MENSPHFDIVDFLLAFGIFASFVVFGICMWFLRRELNKKKTANQKDQNQ